MEKQTEERPLNNRDIALSRFLSIPLMGLIIFAMFKIPSMGSYIGDSVDLTNVFSPFDESLKMLFIALLYFIGLSYFKKVKKYDELVTKPEKRISSFLSYIQRINLGYKGSIVLSSANMFVKFSIVVSIFLMMLSSVDVVEQNGLLHETEYFGSIYQLQHAFYIGLFTHFIMFLFVGSKQENEVEASIHNAVSVCIGMLLLIQFGLNIPESYKEFIESGDTLETGFISLILFLLPVLIIALHSHGKKENIFTSLKRNYLPPALVSASVMFLCLNFVPNLKVFKALDKDNYVINGSIDGKDATYVLGRSYLKNSSNAEKVKQDLIKAYFAENFIGTWSLSEDLIRISGDYTGNVISALTKVTYNSNKLLMENKPFFDSLSKDGMISNSAFYYAISSIKYKISDFESEQKILRLVMNARYQDAVDLYSSTYFNPYEEDLNTGTDVSNLIYMLVLNNKAKIDFTLIKDLEKREIKLKSFESAKEIFYSKEDGDGYTNQELIDGINLFLN